MSTVESRMSQPACSWITPVFGALLLTFFMLGVAARAEDTAASSEDTAAARFASADEAAEALVAGFQSADEKAVLEVLGSEAEPLVDSGDPVADANVRSSFLKLYAQKHEVRASSGTSAILQVGSDSWPFPIPIVRDADGWFFDTAAGEEEILARRIGRNERSAIQSCLAYADAQSEYYVRGVVGEPLRYAQKFASTPGERDGLYFPTEDDQVPSPLGELFAAARAEGYAGEGGGEPFHGYYFRILTAQGADAPGGAYDYVARGAMIGGFAMVAHPAEYGVSGVMTFLVNHDGVVFEKDLGLDTGEIAVAMPEFNPNATWKRSDEGEVVADSSDQ